MVKQGTREAVVAEAYSWLGTPYHHQARIKGVGVDCAMILCEVYHAAGLIPHIDPRPYAPDWHLHRDEERYLGWLYDYGLPTGNPKPGDVGLWRFGRCFSHAGIVVSESGVIHAYLRQGVVLGGIFEQPLVKRPAKFFTLWKTE
jgi:NlpC/P60 family putative phage cell wall peptidase